MNTKAKLLVNFFTKFKKLSSKNSAGFTLLETILATGIASIVITSALGVIASVYFSQKKVQFSHDFFSESRFLMERISQIVRNNTIDYDRYFIEIGPEITSCGSFNPQQTPNGATNNNSVQNRTALGYSTIFYWDTNADDEPDRNLGGVDRFGNPDDCVEAWPLGTTLKNLYLINSAQTLRTHLQHDNNTGEFKVLMSRQLAIDTDDDGTPDTWGPHDEDGDGVFDAIDGDTEVEWFNNECRIKYDLDRNGSYDNPSEYFTVLGNASEKSWCEQAHRQEIISPVALKVNQLQFQPHPNVDPYLAFRRDEVQVHPQVFMALDVELRNPDRYGFEVGEEPNLNFQTSVSSRVFGDIRR